MESLNINGDFNTELNAEQNDRFVRIGIPFGNSNADCFLGKEEAKQLVDFLNEFINK